MLDLITFVVLVAILGFCVWLVVTYIPMPPPFKTAIIVIVLLLVVLYIVRWLVAGGALLGTR